MEAEEEEGWGVNAKGVCSEGDVRGGPDVPFQNESLDFFRDIVSEKTKGVVYLLSDGFRAWWGNFHLLFILVNELGYICYCFVQAFDEDGAIN